MENILLVAVRVLAVLFLFIATIGVVLIYGIIYSGLSVASWVSSLSTIRAANQNMRQRPDD